MRGAQHLQPVRNHQQRLFLGFFIHESRTSSGLPKGCSAMQTARNTSST
jgi:hypothetical protein